MRRFLFVATLIALAALVLPGVGISADLPDRIKNQQERIDQGIRSGELNQKEADIVQDNLNRIKERYDRLLRDASIKKVQAGGMQAGEMKADKKLTDQEEKLGQMLDKNDQMIRDKKAHPVKRVEESEEKAGDFSDRFKNQQERIDQGIRSGELNQKEADIVQDNLNRIKGRHDRMKADKKLTDQEQDKLGQMLDKNDQMIRDKKAHPVKRVEESEEKAGDFSDRFKNQQERIDQGIRSGELNQKEADIVQDNLNRIKGRHDRMKADKKLTDQEQDKLGQMLDKNDQMIRDKKAHPVKRVEESEEKAGDFSDRFKNQQERIDQGIRSGELNQKEADIVQDNLNRIKGRHDRMKADKKLTDQEQDKLGQMLDKNDQMIRDKKAHPVKLMQ